ncbi:MAG: M12 family metallopeptidase [Myxococcota bacterium]
MRHHRFAVLAVPLAAALVVGCADDLDRIAPSSVLPPSGAPSCDLPPGFELTSSGNIVADDIVVGDLAEFEAACAAGRPFPDLDDGRRGVGQSSTTYLWTDGIVPYEIDDDLPDSYRVDDAIAQWEADTSLVFVDRTSEADYVRFTNSDACNSEVGRAGNRQDINLSTGKAASEIIGTGVSPAGDVYTWYADGMVSAGTSTDLDAARAQYPFTPAAGYDVADIVAIAVANDGDVYTWYDDGRRSIGSTSDLDDQSAPAAYSAPAGKIVVEIDIAVDSDVYAWYADGTVSVGTSTNLTAHAAPVAYTEPPTTANIVGIAIANDGDVYTWYDDKTVFIGTSVDLDAEADPSADPVSFATPMHCTTSSVVHEIGHAIGLAHEQSHPDRDDYVRVFEANIMAGKERNFCVGSDCDWYHGSMVYTAYDVTSRMHYGSYGFSVDGTPTLLERATSGATVIQADVVDMSISPSGDVYTWWTDGTVTSGTSDDLELTRSRYPFVVPGHDVSDIVGIAIAKGTGDVYAFYDDGTRSIGSTWDLGSVSGPVAFLLPPTIASASQIVAVDHAPNGRTYAWYDNNRVSSGTSTDLDAYSAPTAFSVAAGRTRSQVIGIAISAAGDTYAWYTPGDVSAGSTTDFDTVRVLYDFESRGIELASSETLTAGDIVQVEAMYSVF